MKINDLGPDQPLDPFNPLDPSSPFEPTDPFNRRPDPMRPF